VRAAWWQEKQDEVVDRSRCRVAAHDQSLHAGLRRFTRKPSGYLVEPQNQDRKLGGWRRDPGAPRSFDVGGRVAGSQGLRREDAVCGNNVAVRWRGVLHDLSAPEGLYHNLSVRGSVVFCLARRGLIYISSRVSRQTIHLDCFSFSCSLGLDFSSICKESDLRVNESFHGCDDSRFVARWIFFFDLFSSGFRTWLVPSILSCLGSDLLVGIIDSCFVHLCA
jgi:hypothetical protein